MRKYTSLSVIQRTQRHNQHTSRTLVLGVKLKTNNLTLIGQPGVIKCNKGNTIGVLTAAPEMPKFLATTPNTMPTPGPIRVMRYTMLKVFAASGSVGRQPSDWLHFLLLLSVHLLGVLICNILRLNRENCLRCITPAPTRTTDVTRTQVLGINVGGWSYGCGLRVAHRSGLPKGEVNLSLAT